MPYRAKLKHILKSLFRISDPEAAEGIWFEGMWLNDNGEPEAAREAFEHACLLDSRFAGAFYNYAALTEKLEGPGESALKAWRAYVPVAERDNRQPRDAVARVRKHIEELEESLGLGKN